MSTHLPVFQSFFSFLHHFVLVKLASSSIRVVIGLVVCAGLTVCPGIRKYDYC